MAETKDEFATKEHKEHKDAAAVINFYLCVLCVPLWQNSGAKNGTFHDRSAYGADLCWCIEFYFLAL
jgi:hypothetical protein